MKLEIIRYKYISKRNSLHWRSDCDGIIHFATEVTVPVRKYRNTGPIRSEPNGNSATVANVAAFKTLPRLES